MQESKYSDPRPNIPTHISRAVNVQSGHKCAIKICGEHTYLEIHHINENREDNRVENLILLCDKHHKMAHNGVIDRKALQEYKKLLIIPDISDLMKRIEKMEARSGLIQISEIITCYHGTSIDKAQMILNTQSFGQYKISYEWLEYDRCFWKKDKLSAKKWAEELYQSLSTVLKVDIFLSKCLSITGPNLSALIKSIYNDYIKNFPDDSIVKGTSYNENCKIVNYVIEKFEPELQTFECFFEKDSLICPGVSLTSYTSAPLWVKDPKCFVSEITISE